jgi:hypothetical protein
MHRTRSKLDRRPSLCFKARVTAHAANPATSTGAAKRAKTFNWRLPHRNRKLSIANELCFAKLRPTDELKAFRKLVRELFALEEAGLPPRCATRRWWRFDVAARHYRSGALAAVHETARGLRDAGAMDKRTMKAFDAMCLTPVKALSATQIRRIR